MKIFIFFLNLHLNMDTLDSLLDFPVLNIQINQEELVDILEQHNLEVVDNPSDFVDYYYLNHLVDNKLLDNLDVDIVFSMLILYCYLTQKKI